MSEMNWHNLKKNKCPQCGKDFMSGLEIGRNQLMKHGCGFMISERKYKMIVSDQIGRRIDYENKNSS